jgi:hypothetical protein
VIGTPYVAYLRVYEPIENFSESNQAYWLENYRYSIERKAEQVDSLRRLILHNSHLLTVNGANLLSIDARHYACPWSTAQRCISAFNDFKSSVPSSVISMFFPLEVDIDTLFIDEIASQGRSHVISKNWMIPPRWFVLFSPEDRLRGRNLSGAFTLLRTEIALAKERCIAAHRAVLSSFGPSPIETELVELLNWLNIFDPVSIVECDYGGLANYLEKSLLKEGEPGLESDSSIEDVQDSILGLSTGDGVQAGRSYERLVTRWRRVAAFEQAT